MRISIVQYDITWEDKEANFGRIEEILKGRLADPDIIVLPEMFTTGFSMNTGPLAEPSGSVTSAWMKGLASSLDAGVCGSYIVREGNLFFNRWIFVTPEGEIHTYDKRHLFSMGGEDNVFTAGRERVVFSFRGIRIFPVICYDLRFPVWSRNRNEYDLLVCSANWPAQRMTVWNTLLKARAIENQCYVVGSNRVGKDGAGIGYAGGSMICGPAGELLAETLPDREGLVEAEPDLSELRDFRKRFPVMKDADDFSIQI